MTVHVVTAKLLGVYLEEQGHAVASVMEQRMGVQDFRFDEGGMVARELLKDFSADGGNFGFSLNIAGNTTDFVTSADAIDNVISTQFTSARLLSDRQMGSLEFSSSNNSNMYKVQSGDTFWDLAKADLGGNASEAEIQARTQQYMHANEGVDPNALQVGQEVVIPGTGENTSTILLNVTLPGDNSIKIELGREHFISPLPEGFRGLNINTGEDFLSGEVFPGLSINENGEINIQEEVLAAGIAKTGAELANTLEDVANRPYSIVRSAKNADMVNITGGKNIGLIGPNGGAVTRMKADNVRLKEALGRPTMSSPKIATGGNALGLGIALTGPTIEYASGDISGAEVTGKYARNLTSFALGTAAGIVAVAAMPVTAPALLVFGAGLAASMVMGGAVDYFVGSPLESAVTGNIQNTIDENRMKHKTLTRRGYR